MTRGSALTDMSMEGGDYLIEGEVERRGGFRHERKMRYRPEEALTVSDRLQLPAGTRAVVFWHLAPGLDASVSGDRVVVMDGKARVAEIRLEAGNCVPRVVRGRAAPDIQGWVSPSYLKRVPAAVVAYRCRPGVSLVKTRIRFASDETAAR
jgi:hypothetical protein